MKRKIIVACGGAVATSTMAAEEIKELCQSHNIPVELIQCRVNEIETYISLSWKALLFRTVRRRIWDQLLCWSMLSSRKSQALTELNLVPTIFSANLVRLASLSPWVL